MKFPAIPGAACNECRTIAVGGSYVGNAATKQPKLVLAFLEFVRDARDGEPLARERARPDRHQGRPLEDQRPARRLLQGARRDQPGAKYYFGIPIQVMQGKPKEVFTQVINNAFPAGTISVDEVVKQMNAAYR